MASFYGTATVGSASGGSVSVWVRAYASLSPSATVAAASTITIDGDTETVNYSSITVGSNTLVGSHQISVALGTSPRSVPWSTYTNLTPGGAGSDSGTVTVPARPPQLPSAPTSASATYVSDSQTTVTWTRPSNAGDYDYIWSQTEIQRWAASTGTWVRVALLTGSPTSWADTTTGPNDRYQYRVRGVNVTGGGEWETTGDVYTTPAAPTGVTATRVGSDIQVAFDHTARFPTGAKVYASQNGGTYSLLATIGTTAETYIHPSPNPAAAWAYKVSATNGSLESAQSAASITVQLEDAPNAPTPLAPLSVRDPAEAVVFQFQHNPVDTSALTAFELQYREQGSGTWTTVSAGATNVSGNVWQVTVAGGTLGLDSTYEWQARTKGDHVDFSPWSTLATFPTRSRPTGTINVPTTAGHIYSALTVVWGYYQAEGSPQAAYRVRLYRGSALLESKSGTGAATSYTLTTVLQDATTYTVELEVQSSDGLWSVEDSVTFDEAYLPPPTPTLSVLYDDATGSATVTITNPGPEAGVEVDTEYNDVYRSVDGGETWVLIATGIPVDGAVSDPVPAIGYGTMNLYRVNAVSSTPSTATSGAIALEAMVEDGCDQWLWLNAGTGLTLRARVQGNLEVAATSVREKALRQYVGRERAVAYRGTARARTIEFAGDLYGWTDNTEAAFMDVEDELLAVYRDPYGRRLVGTVTAMSFQQQLGRYVRVSGTFSGTEGGPL